MDDKTWSKKKLQEFISASITKMMEGGLDFTEVSLGNAERYKVLRSKLLRLGNDTIRSIISELEKKYEVKYLGISEDVVKITNSRADTAKERKGKNDR